MCHSTGQILGCVYTICSYNQTSTIFLHNSQWITLPIQSCLVLYFFCAIIIIIIIIIAIIIIIIIIIIIHCPMKYNYF